MTMTKTAAAARQRLSSRAASAALLISFISSSLGAAAAPGGAVGVEVDGVIPVAVDSSSASASASASTEAERVRVLSDRELASRRRERRRRLGIHRHLQRGANVPIHSRAGDRGEKAVDYGPLSSTTGGGNGDASRRAAAVGTAATTGGHREVSKPTATAPVSSASSRADGGTSASDTSSPRRRSLQNDDGYVDPDGIGGTFGPWWYEDDWTFDSWISTIGHPSEWSYPLPEDYHYDPNGKVFPEWFDWAEYRPIRISARYDLPAGEEAKNAFLTDTVIPGAVQFWSKALMVYPARRLYVNTENCEMASEEDWVNGVTGVDLMLYVRAERECGDGTFAAAGSCDWDQFDKPIGGIVEFCYDSLDLEEDGTASPRTLRVAVETAIHELAHVLGFDSGDMAYYFDRTTGQPRTPRPVQSVTFDCVTPGDQQMIDLPAPSTLREVTAAEGAASKSGRYFEVVTPTVARAAKNHFNCETVQGIRLENQPTAGDCFGDHLEERLLWSDLLSAIATTASVPEYLSPILLALFEDTGWYRANYTMSRIVPFGHGAGCSFLDEPCIDSEGKVPEGNEEYFCDTMDYNVYHCDPSHTVVANCDTRDFSTFAGGTVEVPEVMRLFPDNPNLGGKTIRSDFCPVFGDFVFTCREPLPDRLSNMKLFEEESYSLSSRCFDSDEYARPFCLETVCNEEIRRVQVIVGGETITCETAGQKVPLGSSGHEFTCPSLAVMCPDLVCPSNCAGRGRCLWDEDPAPRCDCFDGSGGGEACFSYRVGYSEDGEAPQKSAEDPGGDGDDVDVPSAPPVDDSGGTDKPGEAGAGASVEDFYGCRDWCADLPVPWKSDDPADTPKCTWWTYSCSQCPQCLESSAE